MAPATLKVQSARPLRSAGRPLRVNAATARPRLSTPKGRRGHPRRRHSDLHRSRCPTLKVGSSTFEVQIPTSAPAAATLKVKKRHFSPETPQHSTSRSPLAEIHGLTPNPPHRNHAKLDRESRDLGSRNPDRRSRDPIGGRLVISIKSRPQPSRGKESCRDSQTDPDSRSHSSRRLRPLERILFECGRCFEYKRLLIVISDSESPCAAHASTRKSSCDAWLTAIKIRQTVSFARDV